MNDATLVFPAGTCDAWAHVADAHQHHEHVVAAASVWVEEVTRRLGELALRQFRDEGVRDRLAEGFLLNLLPFASQATGTFAERAFVAFKVPFLRLAR